MKLSLAQSLGPARLFEGPTRRLPLVNLLVDARSELFELAVAFGSEGVGNHARRGSAAALCGPRYAHLDQRRARRGPARSRASEVVLGGRKIAVQRPRVRARWPRGPAADVPSAWPMSIP